MTTRQPGTILRYLRSLVDAETTRNLSDAQLLQQFAAQREEAAFAALVPPEALPNDAPAAPAEARKDRYGDPLPPGALARLGTVRQRAPESHLAVTADGKEIIALSRDLTVRRFDAQTGKLRSIRQLPKACSVLQYQTWLSPRGTFALTENDGEPRYHLDV